MKNTELEDPTSSEDSIRERFLHWAIVVDHYYTPILCLFGVIGNCLSIVVFFTKSHRARGSLSSSVYLSSLAISDTIFLCSLFLMWLDNLGLNLLTNFFICPSVMYLAQVTSFLSVWFIVAFTVERFFAVCYPLFRHSKCTVSRAKKIVGGLALFALIAFSYVWVISKVQAYTFHPQSSSEEADNTTTTSSSLLLSQSSKTGVKDDSHPQNTPSSSSSSSSLPSHSINSKLPHSHSQSRSGDAEDHFNLSTWMDFSTTAHKDSHGSEGMWEHDGFTMDDNGEEQSGQSFEEDVRYVCSVPKKYHNISSYYSYVDSALTFILPFILISFLNVKIVLCVRKIKRSREGMLLARSGSTSFGPRPKSVCESRRSSRINQKQQTRKSSSLQMEEKVKVPTPQPSSSTSSSSGKVKGLSSSTVVLYQAKKKSKSKSKPKSLRMKEMEMEEKCLKELSEIIPDSSPPEPNARRNIETDPNVSSSTYMIPKLKHGRGGSSGGCNANEFNPKSKSCTKVNGKRSSNIKGVLVESGNNSPSQRSTGSGQILHASSSATTTPIRRRTQLTACTTTEITVTKTLLLVSSVFLILHFPAHLIRIASFIESFQEGSGETLETLNVAQHWANILFNTNFGINFLLYCCSGKAFRHSVKHLFHSDNFALDDPWHMRRRRKSTMLTTQMTQNTDFPSTCRFQTKVGINDDDDDCGIDENIQEDAV